MSASHHPFSASGQVYFDCNATTPTLPQAAEAALEAMRVGFGNPSSTHITGLQARFLLEDTRARMAAVMGCAASELVFTSGATEAIQTAVFSALVSAKETGSAGRNLLLYGATEHKAVPQALRHWNKILGLGLEVLAVPVDAKGKLDAAFLAKHAPRAVLTCTMWVNNETGVVQDLAAVRAAVLPAGSLWLVDAVQALGKCTLDLHGLGCHYASFSGHKLYAPKGIGFLYLADGAPFSPLIVGGGQERGFRSGTENLPGVAAISAIFNLLESPTAASPFLPLSELEGFRERIAAALREAFPAVIFNAPFESSVPTTLNFSVPGLASKQLLDLFDAAGVRVSSGSACSSGKAPRSEVLDAMGVPEKYSASAIRLSFGPATSAAEVAAGCERIRIAAKALGRSCFALGDAEFAPPERAETGVLHWRSGEANTWMLIDRDAGECILIDPVDAGMPRIVEFTGCQGLRVTHILDTHSHADHVSCRDAVSPLLLDATQRSLARDALGWPAQASCHWRSPGGEAFPALPLGRGPARLARVPTPGHTADSVCYVYSADGARASVAFCGDTILSGGLGRTDFGISAPAALLPSLRNLAGVLDAASLLCPAHDYDHSLGLGWVAQRARNPLLELALNAATPMAEAEFLALKKAADAALDPANTPGCADLVCGYVPSANLAKGVLPGGEAHADDDACSLPPGKLRELRAHGSPVVYDVREAHESFLSHDWAKLGFNQAPPNVPLARVVHLAADLLAQGRAQETLLFLCRSGSRSLVVAKAFRRMGFANAWSVEGGLAYGCAAPSSREPQLAEASDFVI